jgi:hypothetical protein
VPGKEVQADYDADPVRPRQSGHYRRRQLFALTLGQSRESAQLLVFCLKG